MSAHPEWLSVGKPVTMIRRLGRAVAWRANGVVTRQTATTVVVADERHGNEVRFRLKHGSYQMTPKYLDYFTTVEARSDARHD